MPNNFELKEKKVFRRADATLTINSKVAKDTVEVSVRGKYVMKGMPLRDYKELLRILSRVGGV